MVCSGMLFHPAPKKKKIGKILGGFSWFGFEIFGIISENTKVWDKNSMMKKTFQIFVDFFPKNVVL